MSKGQRAIFAHDTSKNMLQRTPLRLDDVVFLAQALRFALATGLFMSSRILTLTLNPSIDISGDTEILRPVHKIRMGALSYEAGGGGINVAGVIANLGGDVTALYVSGGATGAMLDELLTERPFKTIHVRNGSPVRISFNLLEQSSGFEYRFVPQGKVISNGAIEECLDAINDFDGEYVVASGSLPRGTHDDLLIRMANIANAKSIRFVVDSSGEALKTTLQNAKVFLAKPSLSEISVVAGKELDEFSVRDAAQAIVNSGKCEMLAVTLGSGGAMLSDENGILRLPALHVRTKSTVGAGDSFLGAMVWALSEGWDREKAFKLGIAAGAAAAMTAGTRLCTAEVVMSLYDIMK